VLDRRARTSARVRESVIRLVSEVREDLTFRPSRRNRVPGDGALSQRGLVAALAVIILSVLTADLVVLGDFDGRERAQAAERNRPPYGDRLPLAGRSDEGRAAPEGRAAAADTGVSDPAGARDGAWPVAPLTKRRVPHLLVAAKESLSSAVVAKVRRQKGVAAVEVADAATVTVDGKRVQTMGVDPSTFRSYTSSRIARSDVLWRGLAAGEMAVSFELGNDGGVKLGSDVAAAGRRLRIGAYATMGMGSIAAVVSRETARDLRIPEGNALVVSAPKADPGKLRRALLKVLPKGGQVVTINPVSAIPPGRTAPRERKTLGERPGERTVWPRSAFMSSPQIETALRAAYGKLGRPYVWGAEGPDSFDCSGLVQWAYAQAGVRMPRVTAQQWAAGPTVPLSEAQPGDLLFWRNDPTNPSYISHVAIYWGDGKMISAPRTGDVVKLSAIYTKNLAGVVRVSPQTSARVR
jgi:cell wall-associated NlpC family hydrolase